MIFLGLLFPKNEEQLIAKKSKSGVVQNQVNMFQWNCIDGLYENGIDEIRIINALPVGSFPNYSEIILKTKSWVYHNEEHIQIGSVNLPILKQFGRCRACKRELLKLQSDDKKILIYSAYQPFLKAVKKLDRSYDITLIVPDIPAYYDYSQAGIIKRLLRKINNLSIYNCIKRVDRFVLLTEAMKYPLSVGSRPYVVVEGISSATKLNLLRNKLSNKKVILYAGSLNKQFGIDILLDAFKRIESADYELWVCGAGDYQNVVRESADRDRRIKYFGFISRDEVLELQLKATVLVNPRQNNGEYTKYSFPSKTMEYLLSGIPLVAYKLSGIPGDYDKYINYVGDNTSESLANMLTTVCEDTDGRYEQIARNAIDFVINEKNFKEQTRKIIELINQ